MQADQRGLFVEAAPGRNGVVDVQLAVAALEIGAAQARRGTLGMSQGGSWGRNDTAIPAGARSAGFAGGPIWRI